MLVQKAASDGALAWSMGRAGRRVLDFCLWPFASFRCDAMTCRLSGQNGLSHVVRPSEFMSSRPSESAHDIFAAEIRGPDFLGRHLLR